MKQFIFIILSLVANYITSYAQKMPRDYRREGMADTSFHVIEQSNRLLINKDAGVWTELNPKIPRVDYISIYFTCPDTGWCVGAYGAIIKTTNGGKTWEAKNSNTNLHLFCIQSYDGVTLIAAGKGGIILRSSNAGDSWEPVVSNATKDIWSIQMTSKDVGWICGLGATLLKTTDGGLTWQNKNINIMTDYWSLKFKGKNGFISCGNGKVLRTKDSGLTWQEKSTGTSNYLYTLYAFDSLRIMAGGFGGVVVKSTDGGDTFALNNLYMGNDIYSLAFANDSLGYSTEIVGMNYHRTTDFGNTWQFLYNYDMGEYSSYFINGSVGYNCGVELRINKTLDKGYSWNSQIFKENFKDIYFINNKKGFLAGKQLYNTNDGGLTWDTVNITSAINKILFLDSSVGFYGYTRIFKTTDGGSNWGQCNMHNLTDSTGIINSFYFQDNSIGWAVTSRGSVYKTNNNGLDWYKVYEAQIYNSFGSVFFLDSLKGWIVGSNFCSLKTTNGGYLWIKDDILSSLGTNNDIYFKDSLNGWMVGETDLKSTTDGGTTWNSVNNVDVSQGRMQWKNKNIGYVFGGKFYKTTNGGASWILDSQQNDILSFHSPELGVGFGAGTLGLVKSYNDPDITPVELKSFFAWQNDNSVTLKWSTATEKNNYGFEVERKDKTNNYKSIAFVKGKGTSSELNNYSYSDNNLIQNIYSYRIKQIDYDGNYQYYYLADEVNLGYKLKYSLEQNYPNPFNPSTTIRYSVPNQGLVVLKLYDILGKEKAVFVNERKESGNYSYEFKNNNLSSGVYFYTIKVNEFVQTRKMVILK